MTAVPKGPALPVAIDIAILPPPEVANRAIALSAALPAGESHGLRLGADRLPHITLTQQFVPSQSLNSLLAHLDTVLRDRAPLHLRVSGGGKGSNAVWMAIERSPELVKLHEQLQQTAAPFEVTTGDSSAFFGDDARDRDVRWVREFRQQSSFDRFTPHITLGHASEPPVIEPMSFAVTTVAVCHLGRFCTCRQVIRAWHLRASSREPKAQSPEPRIC
jgi:2'-5' RNA ligase